MSRAPIYAKHVHDFMFELIDPVTLAEKSNVVAVVFFASSRYHIYLLF